MKTSKVTTISALTIVSTGLLLSSATADESTSATKPAEAKELLATPKGVAPLLGMAATFLPEDLDDSSEYAPFIKLQVPKVVWEVAGKRRPKLEWAKIKADVEMVSLEVHLGYPEATQLAEKSQNRIVDLIGKRLGREEVLKRLGEKTPVLVSVSGEMPDPYYLQCSKPDTLIVIFGLPSSEKYDLLPSSRSNDQQAE